MGTIMSTLAVIYTAIRIASLFVSFYLFFQYLDSNFYFPIWVEIIASGALACLTFLLISANFSMKLLMFILYFPVIYMLENYIGLHLIIALAIALPITALISFFITIPIDFLMAYIRNEVAKIYIKVGENEIAIMILSVYAKRDHVITLFLMGEARYSLSKDGAAIWYEKAAELGLRRAQHKLGMLYLNEFLGAQVDAYVWFTILIEQKRKKKNKEEIKAHLDKLEKTMSKDELAEAQYKLGERYATGEGPIMNLDTAKEYLTKATENGNSEAKTYLDSLGKENKK